MHVRAIEQRIALAQNGDNAALIEMAPRAAMLRNIACKNAGKQYRSTQSCVAEIEKLSDSDDTGRRVCPRRFAAGLANIGDE